jgi:hypothetical protein
MFHFSRCIANAFRNWMIGYRVRKLIKVHVHSI